MLVRRAVVGEEEVVRRLRLAALADAPDAFSSTLDRELARSESEWTSWVDPGPTFLAIELAGAQPGTAVGGALTPTTATTVGSVGPADGTAIGLVGAIGSEDRPDAVELVGLWVAPAARRSGAGSALVGAVVAWAAARGVARVVLGVADGNGPAERLYERHGFARTGRVARAIRAGVVEHEMARPLSSPSTG